MALDNRPCTHFLPNALSTSTPLSQWRANEFRASEPWRICGSSDHWLPTFNDHVCHFVRNREGMFRLSEHLHCRQCIWLEFWCHRYHMVSASSPFAIYRLSDRFFFFHQLIHSRSIWKQSCKSHALPFLYQLLRGCISQYALTTSYPLFSLNLSSPALWLTVHMIGMFSAMRFLWGNMSSGLPLPNIPEVLKSWGTYLFLIALFLIFSLSTVVLSLRLVRFCWDRSPVILRNCFPLLASSRSPFINISELHFHKNAPKLDILSFSTVTRIHRRGAGALGCFIGSLFSAGVGLIMIDSARSPHKPLNGEGYWMHFAAVPFSIIVAFIYVCASALTLVLSFAYLLEWRPFRWFSRVLSIQYTNLWESLDCSWGRFFSRTSRTHGLRSGFTSGNGEMFGYLFEESSDVRRSLADNHWCFRPTSLDHVQNPCRRTGFM